MQLPRVTLVGNSFGGLLALVFTLENPLSVEALVLVGSGGLQPFDEAARQRADRLFSESSLLALTPAMQGAMFSPVFATDSEARQRYLEKQNAKLNREDFRAYARALARTIRFVMRTSCDERLPDIQCRTLLLWGGRDAVIPAEVAVRAAGRIPRCRVKLLTGCGHAPQLGCPGAFTQAIGVRALRLRCLQRGGCADLARRMESRPSKNEHQRVHHYWCIIYDKNFLVWKGLPA